MSSSSTTSSLLAPASPPVDTLCAHGLHAQQLHPHCLGRWDLESVCFSRDRHLLKQWRFITNAHESHPESLGIGFLGPTERFGFGIWGGAHEFAFLTSSQVRQMGGAEHLATGWRLLY